MANSAPHVSLIQIHDDPQIFCTPSGRDLRLCIDIAAARAGSRPFHMLVVPYWHLPAIIDDLAGVNSEVQSKYPNGRIVLMCPGLPECELAHSRGLAAIHAHQNAFIDENIFRPMAVERDFRAIHVANGESWKRHDLAWQVSRIAVVAYNHAGDHSRVEWPDLAGYQDRAYCNLQPDGRFKWVRSQELVQLMNRAHVGLILSTLEGANFASGEYRFCGLPVITTESLGGRSYFLDVKASWIVAPDPEEVARSVSNVLELGYNQQAIRKRAIEDAIPHRERLLNWMSEVSGQNMLALANTYAWLPTFRDKLRIYRPLDDVICSPSLMVGN